MCIPAKLFTKADGEPDLTMSTNLLTSGLEQGTLVISQFLWVRNSGSA